MPEGPQMAYLKEQAEQFVGQPVLNATGSARHIPFDLLIESVLTDIKTFGKEILFCFSDFTIRVHLMLFGKYAINGALNRELRFGLELDTGEINFYACDVRFIYQPLDLVYDWSTDVMHRTFDSKKVLKKLTGKPKLLISEALLDQGILAGVGNIIKNETLFRRRIHPASLVGEIPEKELLNLITECVRFSFEYLEGIRGGADKLHWQVYRKKVCPRDLIPLQKEKFGKAGRSCYFCDKCQRLYHPDSI